MMPSAESIASAIASFAQRPAFVGRDYLVTYEDLVQLADSPEIAAVRMGGVRVIVVLPDGVHAFLTHLLLFLKGAIHVPLSIRSPCERVAAVAAAVKPHLFMTTRALAARYRAVCPIDCKIVVLDDREPDAAAVGRSVSAGLASGTHGIVAEPTTIRYIIFTSGSMGEPKGVCLSASNIVAAAEMNVRELGLLPGRRSLVGVPHFDYYGLIQVYSHVLSGACVVSGGALMFPSDIERGLASATTDLVTVPFALKHIVRQVRKHNLSSFASLQVITCSSDILTDECLQEVFALHPAVRVFDIYGLTEAGRSCFKEITQDSLGQRTLGTPAQGVRLSLIGESAVDGVGEITIEGPNVMLGYFRGIEGEHVVLKHYAQMRTGDLGQRASDGAIKLLGRIGHMINIRGHKVHPAEIERAALAVEGVVDALASRFNKEGGAQIRLELVCMGQRSVIEREVLLALRRTLPPALVPTDIVHRDSLERTEIGSKLRRQAVVQPDD